MKEKIKLVKNLLEKRSARRKEGLFVVEGPHLVEEAIRSGAKIKFVVSTHPQREIEEIEVIKVSREQFAELSEVRSPQGILAVVKMPECKLGDLLGRAGIKPAPTFGCPLIVYCLGVQDPGNLGTIIRSADAFGASGVILSKGTVDLYNPKVVRSTMGSLFHLPIVITEDDQATINYLKENKVKLLATEMKTKQAVNSVDLKGPVTVLVGNEGAGLSEEILKQADETVSIPMAGQAESLNVGMATTVVLYEALRQRIE
jgi:TrmH family RNA methyltransferase